MTSQAFYGAFSIGTSNRSQWLADGGTFPGPGAYNPLSADKPTSPSYQFRDQFPEIDKKKTPGPGTYKEQTYIVEGPKVQIGIQLKQEEKTLGHGPASYVPKNYTLEKANSPKYSFGYRFQNKITSDVPAPGTYPQVEQRGGDFFLDQRFNKHTFDEDKSKFGKSSMSGFGTASKIKNIESYTPGPGNYNVSKYFGLNKTGFQFGSSERLGIYRDSVTPGPGAFDPRQPFPPGRSSTIGFQNKGDKREDFPGPGAYQPVQPKDTKNVLIGLGPQFGLEDRQSLMKPGPGEYENVISSDKVSHLRVKTAAGNSVRPPLNIDPETPGPGAYEIPSKVMDGPKYKMGIKLNDKKQIFQSSTPGPHMYEPNFSVGTVSSPQFSVTKGQRSDPIYSKFKNVGPGSYYPKPNGNVYKMSIGRAKRFQDVEPDDTGPGSYDIGGTFGQIPEYLLSQKRLEGIIDQK